MSTPLKTNEYITLYDLRGPWAEESAKEIILQRINTKIDTIIKEKDKEKEEAVAEARSRIEVLENKIESIWGEACPEGCIFCEEIRYRCEHVLPRLTPPTRELLN